MPNVTLQVTLKNGSLDVDQSGNGNQIAHGQSVTITWHLSGPGVNPGSFNAINDPNHPGFSWIQPPPSGVFGQAQLADNGDKITITDANNSTGSSGEWIYQLCATINGVPYSTISTLPTGTTTNPMIKNL
jgi:hypothetical protein